MKKRIISAGAVLAAALIAMPSLSAAQDRSYGTFHSSIAGGKLISDGYFDAPASDLEVVGARIMVKGMKDGVETVKVIEYTTAGSLQVPRLPGAPGMSSSSGGGGGSGITALFAPISLSPCTLPNEPVLAVGQEYGYHIQWCKMDGSSNPKAAKKNWFYEFSNGTFQLVASFKYSCDDPADTAAMPSAVYSGSC